MGVLGFAGAFPRREFLAYNRTGAATVIGEVYTVDLLDADGNIDSTTADPWFVQGGAGTDPTCNVDALSSGDEADYVVLCVALETGADNAVQRWLLQGLERVFVADNVDPPASGLAHQWLCANTGDDTGVELTTITEATSPTAYAIMLDTNNTGAAIQRRHVLFNGLGFGYRNIT
jgi:hypothetical protein